MSSNSPVRASFTAQRRTRDSTTIRYQNLSQRSPNIDSPNLNEQEIPKDHSHDLKTKLEILLKHNSQLLNENAQLSQLVNTLRIQLDVKNRKEQSDSARVNHEMGNIMVELKAQQQTHQSQLERLLSQISKLHDQCHQMEIDKTNELRRQQQNHERQMVQQITQIRRSQDDGKSLMDLQINKLKQAIEMKDFEYESLKSQMKSQVEQIKTQNQLLQNELEHQRKLKDIELIQMTRRNKDDMRSALKHMQLQKNVEIRQIENRIIRLKKDLANKDIEIEQQAKKITGENEQIFLELSSIKQEKQYLLEEVQTLTETTQQKLIREKQRISQLADLEKENLENLFKNEKESMISEKQKLFLLCEQKSEQIKRLYDTMKKMKETAQIERNELKSLIDGLRSKLKQTQRSNREECELLKIKMAQLHEADVTNLSKYYENEVATLKMELNTIKQSNTSDRQKIYDLLNQNDELRKNFEVQMSKQKAKIQDLKVKFAAARMEFKEQITSLGTKMELTSQSLVRQTQQKQRGAEFFEAEKRKFYKIIDDKDSEIQSIHEAMEHIKKIKEEEVTQQKSQINMLRDSLIAKDQEFKQFKANLEQQYERKSMKLIEQNKDRDPDEQLEKELHQLKGKYTDLEKDNFKKQKDIEFLSRENRSLSGELGLKAGFIESMQMESCAAIQDEKSKIKVLMGKNEVSMKEYYEAKIKSREQDNQSLKKQLSEKETDLRNIVNKYSQLERKLREVLQAQDKLSDFENKLINLGLDQNLIKNMAQLFKRENPQ